MLIIYLALVTMGRGVEKGVPRGRSSSSCSLTERVQITTTSEKKKKSSVQSPLAAHASCPTPFWIPRRFSKALFRNRKLRGVSAASVASGTNLQPNINILRQGKIPHRGNYLLEPHSTRVNSSSPIPGDNSQTAVPDRHQL